ncbi:unnamed protein product [Pedinophyceae sp. YPF-701]|nr:unnamed protein product [Pedinophyceae sp. YPF-701]
MRQRALAPTLAPRLLPRNSAHRCEQGTTPSAAPMLLSCFTAQAPATGPAGRPPRPVPASRVVFAARGASAARRRPVVPVAAEPGPPALRRRLRGREVVVRGELRDVLRARRHGACGSALRPLPATDASDAPLPGRAAHRALSVREPARRLPRHGRARRPPVHSVLVHARAYEARQDDRNGRERRAGADQGGLEPPERRPDLVVAQEAVPREDLGGLDEGLSVIPPRLLIVDGRGEEAVTDVGPPEVDARDGDRDDQRRAGRACGASGARGGRGVGHGASAGGGGRRRAEGWVSRRWWIGGRGCDAARREEGRARGDPRRGGEAQAAGGAWGRVGGAWRGRGARAARSSAPERKNSTGLTAGSNVWYEMGAPTSVKKTTHKTASRVKYCGVSSVAHLYSPPSLSSFSWFTGRWSLGTATSSDSSSPGVGGPLAASLGRRRTAGRRRLAGRKCVQSGLPMACMPVHARRSGPERARAGRQRVQRGCGCGLGCGGGALEGTSRAMGDAMQPRCAV